MDLGDGDLGRGRPADRAAQVGRVEPTVEVAGDHVGRRVGVEAAVVGAVGQHHHVGGEPVASDVAALPGGVRPATGERGRPPAGLGRRSRCRARRGRRPAAPGPTRPVRGRLAAGSDSARSAERCRRDQQVALLLPACPRPCRLRLGSTAQARVVLTGRRPGRRINRSRPRLRAHRRGQCVDDLGRPTGARQGVVPPRSGVLDQQEGCRPRVRCRPAGRRDPEPCPHSGTSARSPGDGQAGQQQLPGQLEAELARRPARRHCHQVRNASRSAAAMVDLAGAARHGQPAVGPVAQGTREVGPDRAPASGRSSSSAARS